MRMTLESARINKGMKQSEMAEALSVSRATYNALNC
ncbi:helix-turn-helix domain-containing protein [Suicoccus acidiformans]|nr:helix-turn-helix domain-containing protein [Suicoccus acidiformans]